MPLTRDQIVDVCDRYCAAMTAGDPDRTVALFAADATHEEPVGTGVRRGHEEIHAFLHSNKDVAFTMTRLGPVTVVGRRAAFQARVDVPGPDGMLSLTATDLVTVDDDGLIAGIVVYPDLEAHPGG